VDGAGEVAGGELALFANVHEVEVVAAVQARLDVLHRAFLDVLL
jgi:hypothetical protein